ncbi:hypothetical protein AB0L06_39855 [Spirillospora sp. NPDC052269]
MLIPTLRAARLSPMLGGALLGLLVAVTPSVADLRLSLSIAISIIRLGAIAIALGTAFVLDDPAAPSTVVVPVSPLTLRAVRAVPALLAGTALWWTVVAVTWLRTSADARTLLPLGGLAIEAGALLLLSLCLAALGLRLNAGEAGGVLAAPGVLLFVLGTMFLPDGAALFVDAQDPHWAAAHQAWAALAVVALTGALLLARGNGNVWKRQWGRG